MKKDDSSLSPDQLDNVKNNVLTLLNQADALGQLPTPVNRIVTTAKLVVNQNMSLGDNEDFLARFTSNIGKAARPHLHGIKKLLGLLHVPSGEILLDHAQHENKKTFIKLHETGHGFLPHQRKMYEVMEDGALELDPETDDLFEREANNFAAETLFQLDRYEKMAADYTISIKTPIDLSKKFGSSVYASMRRYVQTHFSPLALIVYDLPIKGQEDKRFYLRRTPIYSIEFIKQFGMVSFPASCEETSFLGMILKSAKLQIHHLCALKDLNGNCHETALHIFSNSYEKFIMFIPIKKSSNNNSLSCFN